MYSEQRVHLVRAYKIKSNSETICFGDTDWQGDVTDQTLGLQPVQWGQQNKNAGLTCFFKPNIDKVAAQ